VVFLWFSHTFKGTRIKLFGPLRKGRKTVRSWINNVGVCYLICSAIKSICHIKIGFCPQLAGTHLLEIIWWNFVHNSRRKNCLWMIRRFSPDSLSFASLTLVTFAASQQSVTVIATRTVAPNICKRGRCYDHNFLRFLTIFGEKNGAFLKNQCYGQLFA
jgi:hypothetical protein